jgi:hypothetical protein
MASIRQKLKRLEATTQKVEAFATSGGDLRSPRTIEGEAKKKFGQALGDGAIVKE